MCVCVRVWIRVLVRDSVLACEDAFRCGPVRVWVSVRGCVCVGACVWLSRCVCNCV